MIKSLNYKNEFFGPFQINKIERNEKETNKFKYLLNGYLFCFSLFIFKKKDLLMRF